MTYCSCSVISLFQSIHPQWNELRKTVDTHSFDTDDFTLQVWVVTPLLSWKSIWREWEYSLSETKGMFYVLEAIVLSMTLMSRWWWWCWWWWRRCIYWGLLSDTCCWINVVIDRWSGLDKTGVRQTSIWWLGRINSRRYSVYTHLPWPRSSVY